MISSEAATLVAGLGGAVVGGFIAGCVQWLMSQRERRARRWECAVHLIQTATAIRTQTTDFEETISQMRQRFLEVGPSENRSHIETWEPITPIIGNELVAKPSPGDMLPLIEARAYGLVRDFNIIVSRHYTLHAAIEEFSRIRRDMSYILANVREEGEAVLGVPAHEWQRVAPHRVQMSSLVNQILPANTELKDRAADVAEKIGTCMVAHFRDQRFPRVEFPDRPRPRKRPWWIRLRSCAKTDYQ